VVWFSEQCYLMIGRQPLYLINTLHLSHKFVACGLLLDMVIHTKQTWDLLVGKISVSTNGLNIRSKLPLQPRIVSCRCGSLAWCRHPLLLGSKLSRPREEFDLWKS
jgi:hypothetical protein